MVPIRPPQGRKETKPPPNEDPHTTQLMKNVKEAFNTANKLIDNMAPHDEIEQAFNKLARARLNLKTHKRSFQDQQLHQFVSTGNLNFSLTGPTLNEAWHCLQQAASKIKRKSSSLPKLMYTNTLDLIDKTRWLASPLPAATAALSARAWGQFRYALGHHKRNHPLSPFDEIEAQKVEQQTVHLHNITAATQDAQVDQDTTNILNRNVNLTEICKLINSAPPDKSPGMDGITNRMLQGGGDPLHRALFYFMETIWLSETYPDDWTKALMQPIYKGGGKPIPNPESYRGICLTCATTKLFEGILNQRLDVFTQKYNTLTPYQYGSKKGSQSHDAIYVLSAVINNNNTLYDSPTYCAFIDFSTAYPSVHRDRLTLNLFKSGIRGKMWRILKQTYHKVSVRVLHPLIPEDDYTQILRGLPEGSRLSPTLFGILIAELLQEIKHRHPDSDTIGPGGTMWVGALAFVDDLVLTSRCPFELQNMINTCQRWCEKARIEINTDKTKIVHFNKPATKGRPLSHSNTWYINRQPTSAAAPQGQVNILNTNSFKYLGVTLDHLLNMKELQGQIIQNIEASNAKLQRMLSEIRSSRNYYSPHHSTLGGASTAPNTTLHLWKSCVLVQATQYIKYMPPNHIKDIQIALNKTLLQTFSCHEPASQPITLMADLGIPPLTHYRHLDLVRLHYRP